MYLDEFDVLRPMYLDEFDVLRLEPDGSSVRVGESASFTGAVLEAELAAIHRSGLCLIRDNRSGEEQALELKPESCVRSN